MLVTMYEGSVGATVDPDLTEVRHIVCRGLAGLGARVFLFGSWARGQARRTSDIDVGILPQAPLPPGVMGLIREALEESAVMRSVDLIDLSTADQTFRELILREAIPWNE